MSNPFGKYVTKTKKVSIAALDGAEVEVREPTVIENTEFYTMITDAEGKLIQTNFMKARIKRVSDCMIEPKLSPEELEAMSASANAAIGEIYDAIEALVEKPKGN